MFYSAKSEGGNASISQRLPGAKATGYEWLGLISEFCYYFLLWWSGSLLFRISFPLDLIMVLSRFGVSSCWEKELTQENFFGYPRKTYSLFGSPSLFLESILCFSYLRALPWRWVDEEDWWKTWSDPKKWCIWPVIALKHPISISDHAKWSGKSSDWKTWMVVLGWAI